MNIDQAIDKARKLLALSASSNPNEAALAAKMAQAVLERHSISQAMLELDSETELVDEPIDHTANGVDPLDHGSVLATYRQMLASCVGEVNGCQIYTSTRVVGVNGRGGRRSRTIEIVGRASDIAKVRYLYAYLVRETDRLTDRDGRGMGRTWRNNFRIGCVQSINEALRGAKHETLEEIRKQAGGDELALVRVDKALENIDERRRELGRWVRENLRLGRASSYSFADDRAARAAGRRAGREVQINGACGALGTGRRQIRGQL